MTTRRSTAARDGEGSAGGPRVLKKYPNRRLYDTLESSYITLGDVKHMVLRHEQFEVRDAKTGEDLTRSILLQIILEEETGGLPMFTAETLAQMIRFYGHAMQGAMGSMLEHNMRMFTQMQQRLAEQSKGLYDPGQFTPDSWAQAMSGQAPTMQSMMNTYLEQSKQMFAQMQQQTQAMFGIKPEPPKNDH